MVGSFWGHSVSSQWTHKMSSHCELVVSLLWAFPESATLTVSSLLPLHGELIGMISRIAHSKLTVWVANPRKAHSKLTVWVILWVHCELTECPQNEPIVSFMWAPSELDELKFFTGYIQPLWRHSIVWCLYGDTHSNFIRPRLSVPNIVFALWMNCQTFAAEDVVCHSSENNSEWLFVTSNIYGKQLLETLNP